MLKPVPNVYVPVEPDADGLGLPTLLSLVVHGSILAFIIFSHRIPEIETPPTIETTIVTPEELANLQSDIIANRQAMAEANTVESFSEDVAQSELQYNDEIITNAPQQPTDITSGVTSIFTRSSRPPDPSSAKNRPVETVEQPDIEQVDDFDDEEVVDNPFGDDFSTEENPGGRVTETFKPNSEGGKLPGGSEGNSINEAVIETQISNMIVAKWTPPRNQVGRKVTASVTVDVNGNVTNVKGDSSDSVLNLSIESAVRSASPLTPLVGTGKRKIKLEFVVK